MQPTIVSTLTTLYVIHGCLKTIAALNDRNVLFRESVDGSVESGNYSYYSYNGADKLLLVLTTHSGDADLYVSQSDASGRAMKPLYDFPDHDLQSVTCGEDVVRVDDNFRRPIGIAVYGHPSHETSRYTLDVIGVHFFDDLDATDDNYVFATDDELTSYEEFFGEQFRGLDNKVPKSRHKSGDTSGAQKGAKEGSDADNGYETWDFVINLLANILHILLEAIL